MRGVFIHVLGDALGSVMVMISAGITIVSRHYLGNCDEQTLNSTKLSNSSLIIDLDSDCPHNDPEWVLCIDPILRYVHL